jgi:hypothetical protein
MGQNCYAVRTFTLLPVLPYVYSDIADSLLWADPYTKRFRACMKDYIRINFYMRIETDKIV